MPTFFHSRRSLKWRGTEGDHFIIFRLYPFIKMMLDFDKKILPSDLIFSYQGKGGCGIK